MKKAKDIISAKQVYDNGGNVIHFLKGKYQSNTIEDILISYELQAGTDEQLYLDHPEFSIEEYVKPIADIINNEKVSTVMEAGAGECTIIHNLAKHLKIGGGHKFDVSWHKSTTPAKIDLYGFDLSWSRLHESPGGINLFTADMFNIPMLDNSIDVVFTSHAIEPNGGRADEALAELYRVTKKLLILLEPAYDFATQEGKDRMIEHGYITDLHRMTDDYNVIKHEPYYTINPLNPTGITVIAKDPDVIYSSLDNPPDLVCPVTHEGLVRNADVLFCPESFLSYPIIKGIPCLLADNGILTKNL